VLAGLDQVDEVPPDLAEVDHPQLTQRGGQLGPVPQILRQRGGPLVGLLGGTGIELLWGGKVVRLP
jgi:hypothetical protein